MVSPEYPEIFKRESFQEYAENISDWRSLKKAVMLWQRYPLSRQQESNLRFYAPMLGIYSQADKQFKLTGLKITQDKRGRFLIRDSKGKFARAGESRYSHHAEDED